MIYQDPLNGIRPYVAKYITGKGFPDHKHYEIEIIYCLEGFLDLVIKDENVRVCAGEALIIGSLTSHAYKKTVDDTKAVLIEMGPVFLQEKFQHVSDLPIAYKLYPAEEKYESILSCLRGFSLLFEDEDKLGYMLVIGKMYELFVHLVRDLSKEVQSEHREDAIDNLAKIDRALSLVHERYNDQISIDDASSACGYGKSNFCRVFKNVMGVSFHQYLNNYRIENAKYLLAETALSIERVAIMVGFQDAKVFCRVFKQTTDKTPGQYRKSSAPST